MAYLGIWNIAKACGRREDYREIFLFFFILWGFVLYAVHLVVAFCNPPYEVKLRTAWNPSAVKITASSEEGDVLLPIKLALHFEIANLQSVQTKINSFYNQGFETEDRRWIPLPPLQTQGRKIFLTNHTKAFEVELVLKHLDELLRKTSLQANETVSGVALFSLCHPTPKGIKSIRFHLKDARGTDWEEILSMPQGRMGDVTGTVITQEEFGIRVIEKVDIPHLKTQPC